MSFLLINTSRALKSAVADGTGAVVTGVGFAVSDAFTVSLVRGGER